MLSIAIRCPAIPDLSLFRSIIQLQSAILCLVFRVFLCKLKIALQDPQFQGYYFQGSD